MVLINDISLLHKPKQKAMKATEIKTGQKVTFTPTGLVLVISTVTNERISWYTGKTTKSSWGKNNMRMAWTSIEKFQTGLDSGVYILS